MFPALYHIHNSRDADDQEFWHQLAKKQGSPILELGCGTGRILLHLAQPGFHLYGLDINMQMLKYLQHYIPASLARQVNIFQGDMCEFRLGLRFALILLPCNTYSMLSNDQRAKALERVYWHLHPDGVFALSIPNPFYLQRLPRQVEPEIEDIFPHPLDGEPVQVSSAWKRSQRQMTISWFYDHLLPDGSVERLGFEVMQQIIPVDLILREFHSAGLYVNNLYGDFDGSPFSSDSTYLILTAGKGTPQHF